jgi:hypothetical protein
MVLPRRDSELYRAQWNRALSLHPELIVIYSWNEYFEQTAIEPTDAWGESVPGDDRLLRGARPCAPPAETADGDASRRGKPPPPRGGGRRLPAGHGGDLPQPAAGDVHQHLFGDDGSALERLHPRLERDAHAADAEVVELSRVRAAAGVTAWTEHLLGAYPLTTPIVWITGNPVLAYGVLLVGCFVLNGLTMFAARAELTQSDAGAFVAEWRSRLRRITPARSRTCRC